MFTVCRMLSPGGDIRQKPKGSSSARLTSRARRSRRRSWLQVPGAGGAASTTAISITVNNRLCHINGAAAHFSSAVEFAASAPENANGGRDRSRPPLCPGRAEVWRRVCDCHRPGAARFR